MSENGSMKGNDDLWLACLLQLCRHHSLVRHPAQLLAGLPLQKGRLDAALIERAARHAGFDTGLVALRDADNDALPALARDTEGSPVLLLAINAGSARIARPETAFAESTVDTSALSPDIWWLSPLQLTDVRGEEFVPTKPRHWLYEAINQARPWYRDILIATVALNVLALLVPLYTMNVYDRVVPNQAFESLWTLSVGVLIAVFFDWALRSARATLSDTAGRRIDVQLSATLLGRVLGMRLENRPQSVGAFARQVQDFDSVREFLSSATVTVLIDLPFLLLFLALIAWLGGPMVLLPLLALVLLGGYALLRQRSMKASLDEASKLGAQRQALLMESLLLIGDVKQHNLEGRTQRRWEQAVAAQADHNIRVRHDSNALAHAIANSQTLITVALIVAGVYRIADGALSMGGLIAIVMLAGRATSTISQSVMLLLRYQQMRTALTGLDAVMAMPQENHPGLHLQREALRGEIRLRDVSFSYAQSKRAALEKISLTIKPGERIGLVGVAGAGKSTLLALLAGQLRASSGDLQYDGIGATLWPTAALREQSGWLAQQPSLFFGSLLDNILLERHGVSDAQLRSALQRAGIDRFLPQLEQGLETAVGELGRQLSGGQRQAVALARALLGEPRLLLLDEPTSAMDRDAELQVQEALRQWPREGVMILASHRLELLSLCDRLIVIDGGRVVRDGSSAEILASLCPTDSQRVTRIHLQTGPNK